MQLRHCEIVQDEDKLKVDIQATCMKYQTIKQLAYILHDKDDTRPHYHIYLNFGKSSLDTTLVAKWFELGYVDEDGQQKSGEQFVNKVKRRKVSMLQYLTHENESQKFKHVYARSEVIANFDFGAEIDLYNNIGDFDRFSYAQQLQSINELPIAGDVANLKAMSASYVYTAKTNKTPSQQSSTANVVVGFNDFLTLTGSQGEIYVKAARGRIYKNVATEGWYITSTAHVTVRVNGVANTYDVALNVPISNTYLSDYTIPDSLILDIDKIEF